MKYLILSICFLALIGCSKGSSGGSGKEAFRDFKGASDSQSRLAQLLIGQPWCFQFTYEDNNQDSYMRYEFEANGELGVSEGQRVGAGSAAEYLSPEMTAKGRWKLEKDQLTMGNEKHLEGGNLSSMESEGKTLLIYSVEKDVNETWYSCQ